ncbi:MAG: hypothetical protein Q8S00_32695 [Deltaproteobacteria bacterium]|nr:hypothetical protein [Deltaproteobacteria bacterium]
MTSYAKYQLAKFQEARTPGDYVGVVTQTEFRPNVGSLQRYGAPNLRSQLTSTGVGEVHATLAIPYMGFIPRSSDADSQGVQIIIKAIQKRLGVKVTGYLDDSTQAAIQHVSGDDWFDKNWGAILGDAIIKPGLSGYVSVGDVTGGLASMAKPLGLVALGVWGYAWATKNKKLQEIAGGTSIALFVIEVIGKAR